MAENIAISADDVSWGTTGARILDHVSFDIDPGTIVACLGPNGAGKTTLLNLLSGWIAPSSGGFKIDGQRRVLTPEKAFGLGIVRRFDPPKLIRELSVSDNIRLADRLTRREGIFDALLARFAIASTDKDTIRRAEPLLRAIGIHDKLLRPAGELSVGEQKLLDIAVGLQAEPRCLLLDEPLKDRIDEGRKNVIARRLRDFAAEGGSALIIEHDLDFVRACADKILVLDRGGRLVWNGTTTDRRTWDTVDDIYHDRGRRPPIATAVAPASADKAPADIAAHYRLKATGLTARYGGTSVLLDAAISLRAGEIATLRGENGAGKSTLLFAIAGLLKASGSVQLDGSDISDMPAYKRAREGIILVAQEHKVFPSMTVAENILLSAASGRKASKELLDRAFGWFPELKSRVDTATSHLSSGQKQMVALARAFLRSPRCLLLDEPTSGLDPGIRARVRDLIHETARNGAAVLLVEHIREGAAEDEVITYTMKGGRIKSCTS